MGSLIAGWSFAFFCLVAAGLAGLPWARKIQGYSIDGPLARQPSHPLLFAVALGLVIQTKLLFLLALAGGFTPAGVVFCILLPAVAGVKPPSMGRGLWAASEAFKMTMARLHRQPLVAALGGLLLILVVVASMPPRHADALRYHLTFLNALIFHGRLQFFPDVHWAFCQDGELLYAAGMLIAGDRFCGAFNAVVTGLLLVATPNFEFLRRAHALLGRDSRVGVALNSSSNFYLGRPYIPIDPWLSGYVDYGRVTTPEALVARLDELGLTHILFESGLWAVAELPVSTDTLLEETAARYYTEIAAQETTSLANRILGTKRHSWAGLYERNLQPVEDDSGTGR